MTNSEQFYQTAKRFQDERAAATDKYEKRIKELEAHRGSAYYNSELKDAQDAFLDELDSLKGSARRQFDGVLAAMRKANSGRGMSAPTQEQLNILAALKMRTSLTRGELDRAANNMGGNALALSVLDDMARNNGIAAAYSSKSKEAGDASAALDNMAASVADFIEYDTTKETRAAAKFAASHYGVKDTPLKKRALFTDKAGCFREVANIGGNAEEFFTAVDGTADNGGTV